MGHVTGVGGIFFRSKDPAALAEWYNTHLGIDKVPCDYDAPVWMQHAGPTVFVPFPKDSEYFGDAQQNFMINFRVDDLDAIVADLEKAGIEVARDPEQYPNGQFARLHDPEGNPVELWQTA